MTYRELRSPLLLALAPLLLSACKPALMVGGTCEYYPEEPVWLEVLEVGERHVMVRPVGPADSRLMRRYGDPETLLEAVRPPEMQVAPGDRVRGKARVISKGSCVPVQVWLLGEPE